MVEEIEPASKNLTRQRHNSAGRLAGWKDRGAIFVDVNSEFDLVKSS
jgi:hypothetical protein